MSELGPPFPRLERGQKHLPQHEHTGEQTGEYQEGLEFDYPFGQDGNPSVFSDNHWSSSSFSRSLTKRDRIRLAKAAAAMTAIGVVPTRLIR